MPRVFHQQYTRPIPPNAKRFSHKGKPAVRFTDSDGKTVVALLTKGGDRCRVSSPVWYGQYVDADGIRQRVPLCENKTAAEQMLAELVRKAGLGRVGLRDPFERHRNRPLAEHLAEWGVSLLDKGATAKHVKQTLACARRLIASCGFVFMADLSGSRVETFLASLREQRRPLPPLDPQKGEYTRAELATAVDAKPSAVTSLVRRHRLAATGKGKARRYPRATVEALRTLRSRGRSIKTANLYLDAIKAFAAWLVLDRRAADNPLAHLSGGNVRLDRRHDRRALTMEEIRQLLEAATASGAAFRGLMGRDRRALYMTVLATGFRAEEASCLRPRSFDLDGTPPTATLGAAETKNGKDATQPLPPDVAWDLRAYLAGRPDDLPVWPGNWYDNAADMLRLDLDAAGIPYAVDGPSGPLYADFHALRHSYIALLDKSGATLKEAMQLARHSDPKLTMAVYGRAQLHDLGRAVGNLHGLAEGTEAEPGVAAATGTDGAYTPLTHANDTGREGLRLAEGPNEQGVETATATTP